LDNFKDFINSRRGAIAGEDLTPMNRAGMIVAGMGIGPEGPGHVGDTVLGLQRNRQAEMQAQRDAARLGLERQQFEETQYRNRLPHFQQVGQNEDGLPIYGWVNPTQAPGAPQDTFRAGNGAYAAQRLPLPDLQQGVQGPAADGSPSQAVQKTPGVFAAPVYGQQEVDAQTTNLTGEAFLKYLEDHGQKPRADMIRAISEGRERFPESPRNATERALRRQDRVPVAAGPQLGDPQPLAQGLRSRLARRHPRRRTPVEAVEAVGHREHLAPCGGPTRDRHVTRERHAARRVQRQHEERHG
jgi:hypothetical protein